MKILIVSPHFPTPDVYGDDLSLDPRTKFLITYAREWQLKGHEVTVLHTIQKFPKLFSFALDLLAKIMPRFSRFRQVKGTTNSAKYYFVGISIVREPIIKVLPHAKLSRSRVRRYVHNKLISNGRFKLDNFDVAFLDYLSPSLDIFEFIKFDGRKIPIFHQTDWSYFERNERFYIEQLKTCSDVFFRNKTSLDKFKHKFPNLELNSRIMYSGVPNNVDFGTPKKSIRRLLYVGRILKSKNIQDTLSAISYLPEEIRENIIFDIVGEGDFLQDLKKLTLELGIGNQVRFTPKLPHEQVFAKMANADALVMVSKETFGMVYVEALSQGCVVLAAKNEGIDGVVVEGINGFLLPLNQPSELADKVKHLYSLDEEEVQTMSRNAIETASKMRNQTLACDLISSLK